MRQNTIVIPVSVVRRVLLMLVVLIVLVLLVIVVRAQLSRLGISNLFSSGATELVDRNAYQAVWLVNGSTYFGKLQQQGDEWFALTDIFYLSVTEQNGTQLIKRGSEPQGPREPMIIPRQQVLFIENLREDSDVVTAIHQFKAGTLPIATPPPATPPPATPTPTAAPSTARPSPTR